MFEKKFGGDGAPVKPGRPSVAENAFKNPHPIPYVLMDDSNREAREKSRRHSDSSGYQSQVGLTFRYSDPGENPDPKIFSPPRR